MTAANAVVADHGLRDEQLDVAGAVAHRGEDQLAGVAQQHDAPGDARPGRRSRYRLQVAPRGPQLGRASCVRSKRYGYGSVPVARIASTRPSRRARSAARPLPAAVSSTASCVGRIVICHGGSTVASSRRRGRIRFVPDAAAGAVDSLRSCAVRRLTALLAPRRGPALDAGRRPEPDRSDDRVRRPRRPPGRCDCGAPVIDIVTVNNSGELTAANASAAAGRGPRRRRGGGDRSIGEHRHDGGAAGRQRRADRAGRLRLSDGRHRAAARDGGEHDGPVDLGSC